MRQPPIKPSTWRQIGGDVNPGAHGATIARYEGDAIEIREIQPVRSLVGDDEALEVGFPFWTRAAYYQPEDLALDNPQVQAALRYCGQEPDCVPPDLLLLAECCLAYGHLAEEGPAGWAKDVVPGRVKWWTSVRPCGWRWLAEEDRDFRALLREAKRAA